MRNLVGCCTIKLPNEQLTNATMVVSELSFHGTLNMNETFKIQYELLECGISVLVYIFNKFNTLENPIFPFLFDMHSLWIVTNECTLAHILTKYQRKNQFYLLNKMIWKYVFIRIQIKYKKIQGAHSILIKVITKETLTRTVVIESYLNDFVCPFSKKTFNTFAICGTCKSPNENADGFKWKRGLCYFAVNGIHTIK